MGHTDQQMKDQRDRAKQLRLLRERARLQAAQASQPPKDGSEYATIEIIFSDAPKGKDGTQEAIKKAALKKAEELERGRASADLVNPMCLSPDLLYLDPETQKRELKSARNATSLVYHTDRCGLGEETCKKFFRAAHKQFREAKNAINRHGDLQTYHERVKKDAWWSPQQRCDAPYALDAMK